MVIHLLPQPGYAFHRDEFLYLAMADHLHLLRMSFPPMIAILGEIARALPIPLLAAVRLLPALADAAMVVLVAMLARELGGNRRAQLLASLVVLLSPHFLRSGTLFQPVIFEHVAWAVALLALAALLAGRDRRWWLVAGAAIGVAALTKFSVAFLLVGVMATVFLSPLRPDLRTRWPWLAAALAAVLALPTLLGQMAWDWPFFAQAAALKAHQLGNFNHKDFVVGQFLAEAHAFPVWIVGLVGLLVAPSLRRFRGLGALALTVFVVLLVAGGKAYYFGPVHVVLIAAAAVLTVGWLDRPGRRWALLTITLLVTALGVLLVPLGVPILPPARMAAYAQRLGQGDSRTNYGGHLPLPQDFADMTGWHDQVATVARVFHDLSPQDRAVTSILGNNYGRIGAVALYHEEFALPYPVGRHGDFWFWGANGQSGAVTIIVGGTAEQWQRYFGAVTEAARARSEWGVDEEQDVPIYVARQPRMTLPAMLQDLGPYWG